MDWSPRLKFAFVDGRRSDARPGLRGVCPKCDDPLTARCGEVYRWHWAHPKGSDCDYSSEESEWHLNWKDKFPDDWQEVLHKAEDGERRIADVKTDQDWVLEFQHSRIDSDVREGREAFYENLIWIVDGAKRKRDKKQFFKALQEGKLVVKELNLWRVPITDECALLRDWSDSRVPVFFDFGGSEESEDSQLDLVEDTRPEQAQLWCVIRVINGMAYGGPFLRQDFMRYHSPAAKTAGLDFSALMKKVNEIIEVTAHPGRRARPSHPRDRIWRRYQQQLRRQRNRPFD